MPTGDVGAESLVRHPYASQLYARSFSPRFTVIDNPEWSTFLLERPILGSNRRDATGPYPVSSIAPDANLAEGLRYLEAAGLVSVVLVADPLWSPDASRLAASFSVCRPFKTHHLVKPGLPLTFSASLRRNIRIAHASCVIRIVTLKDCLDDWMRLFNGLLERHRIEGLSAFSRDEFLAMEDTPGLFAAIAEAQGEVVSITLWIRHGDVVYFHLAASSDQGYKLMAASGLVAAIIEQYRTSTVDLGGCAGLRDDPNDGLWWFKQRFGNATATAMLCGAILDPKQYAALAINSQSEFFPAYRSPTV